jgi:hypothetical protein
VADVADVADVAEATPTPVAPMGETQVPGPTDALDDKEERLEA